MPNTSIYLSEDIYKRLKAARLNVSAVCKEPIAQALKAAEVQSKEGHDSLAATLMRAGMSTVEAEEWIVKRDEQRG